MPYEGEYAGYRSLQRIAENERVKHLIRNSRVCSALTTSLPLPRIAPPAPIKLPSLVFAIDGSNAEIVVRNGYPGARVGYCTVASILLDLDKMNKLDENRPTDPVEFRRTEDASAIDAALPGSNVVTRNHTSARHSFRAELYEMLHSVFIDEEDGTPILETYEALLAYKPDNRDGQQCPYNLDHDCEMRLQNISNALTSCPCNKRLPLYSTDALRIHEGFRDLGSNREILGEVMQIWERLLLVHLLRCFEKNNWLDKIHRIAFIIDGPLAIFGNPAWLSSAIKSELIRINDKVKKLGGSELLILGVEKTGEFVSHFEEIDNTDQAGVLCFTPRSYQLLTDKYIKERIKFSPSLKRFGQDTYFGRKLFYKTLSGARLVVTIPFLSDTQDTIENDDISLYPQFSTFCALLDRLVSSRFTNALAPLISANSHAAIPLHLGTKVLQQLARALLKAG